MYWNARCCDTLKYQMLIGMAMCQCTHDDAMVWQYQAFNWFVHMLTSGHQHHCYNSPLKAVRQVTKATHPLYSRPNVR